MKKQYLKPEVEYLNFTLNENIATTDEDDYIGSVGGEAGAEEW